MPFDVSSIFAQQVQAVSKSDTGRELVQVDIDDLVGNDANFYAVDEDKLEELKNSIALSGIMDPPTVTRTEDGKYRLISGHRRTAAVRALVAEGREDLRKVPVFVRSPKSAAMEELELIMANSTARVLTSAEIVCFMTLRSKAWSSPAGCATMSRKLATSAKRSLRTCT